MSAPRRKGTFAGRIVSWQAEHGRQDLPWQRCGDPYRVWISEVMLQQTQVATVLPYFRRFCSRFPDIRTLAAASLADVLSLWSGLGYYARARNLHACARRVVDEYDGHFPTDAQTLAKLPGLGRTTAAAIAAFCFGERVAILDGNVKRVLTRYFSIEGYPGEKAVRDVLWSVAESQLPERADMPVYTQGLMDLGATICTRRAPACDRCPVRRGCQAFRRRRVDELPVARPRKHAPERSTWMLIPSWHRQVMLQQRALTGLWGGLLAPLQFDSFESLRSAAFAMDASARPQPLSPRRHAFTHFTLTMHPYRLELRRKSLTVRENDQVWLRLSDAATAALPAPIRALLDEFASRNGPNGNAGKDRMGTRLSAERRGGRRSRTSMPTSSR